MIIQSISYFSMYSDEKFLQYLMSKDFTARYAGDDDQFEDDHYSQERPQNIPPASLIEQMVRYYYFFYEAFFVFSLAMYHT